MVTFSAHMIQHMTLSMIAPIFIILSAPLTLALRALPASSDRTHRNARSWILGLLHSRYTFIVTQPLFILFLFTVGLYGIYFTSAFSALMASHVGHVFMEFHFLMTGLLFTFVIIGVDPSPRKVPYWGKLLLVLVAISVHTFFALALMQSTAPIGAQWYSQVQPSWLTDPLSDTYSAGGIAWSLGEVPSLLLLLIVAVQWSRSDTRLARQQDRAAERDGDAQLNAYNDNLARLNQHDPN
jgi:putative copper resistance protein D